MFYHGTMAASVPERVTVENFADGRQVVRMTDNVCVDAGEDEKRVLYDEVVFEMPRDRRATKEDVASAFEGWWEYGKQAQKAITLEQRVSDLEEIILGMLEG